MAGLVGMALFFSLNSNAQAEKVIQLDADRQFSYAEHLFSEAEYFRAIGEYKRFIFFFPDDERVLTARFNIGMSFFHSQRFREAFNAFDAVIQEANPDDPVHADMLQQAFFMKSECAVKLDNPDAAALNLDNLIRLMDDPDIQDAAHYKKAWVYLESGAWKNSAASLEKISPQNYDKYAVDMLKAELDQAKAIPRKNPKAAGVLSIIPGAGQLYCGRYQDALVAFLLNGGLMLASCEAFDDENYALGGVISFVGLGFYAGNIYGAVSSAHKYNKASTQSFIEKLKRKTQVFLSTSPWDDRVCLSVAYRF